MYSFITQHTEQYKFDRYKINVFSPSGDRCKPTVKGVLESSSEVKSISRGRLFMGMCIFIGATAIEKQTSKHINVSVNVK